MLQEAQEIFGDVSDLLEEYSNRRRQVVEDDDREEDAILEGDYDDDEAEERQRELVKTFILTQHFLKNVRRHQSMNLL